jgi:ankyrin repeat protein
MALFCTEYLLSSPFDYTTQADELNNHVRSGYYALQDYALSHWLDHMTHSLRAENPPDISIDTRNDLVSQLRSFVEEYGVPEKSQYLGRIQEDGDLLDSIPKDISAWSQWFDLEWRTRRVRGAIESLGNGSTSDDTDRDMMRDIYGTRLFKCSRLACNLFTTGFNSKTEREDHLNEHERPFHCVEQSCPYHTLGFRTEAELESHLTHNHPEDDGDKVSFPEPPIKKKRDSIFKACARGDIVAVKSFLDNGEDINRASRPKGRETPLYVAAENGRLNVCKMLLDRGADINHEGKQGHIESTALDAAVSSSHLEIIQYFSERSDILEDQRDRHSNYPGPLHLAIKSKSEAVFHALLDCKTVDLNALRGIRQREGRDYSDQERFRTPLMLAAETGQERMVKMLLAIDGVDLNLKDRRGRTALAFAVAENQEVVVKILLANGKVDPNTADENGWTPIIRANERGYETIAKLLLATGKVKPDIADGSGQTLLTWAAGRGCETIIKLLLATSKVDPNTTDGSGRTPLRWAAERGHETVIKLLLATDKVDPNILDGSGQTPLSWAAERGHEMIVKLLLATDKIDPETSDKNDRTPLSWAAERGHETIVKLLLATDKVNPEISDKSGRTPTIWAAQEGHEMIVKLLLATDKVNSDAKDRNGRTTLLRALVYDPFLYSSPQKVAEKRRAIVNILLSTGHVDIDARDETGESPLMCLARSGSKELTQLLLDVGANPDLEDWQGQTALDKAVENGWEEVIELLRGASNRDRGAGGSAK